MCKNIFVWVYAVLLLVQGLLFSPVTVLADTDTEDWAGQWYGTWHNYVIDWGANLGVYIDQDNGYAIINAPEYYLFYQPLPATFEENFITISTGDYTFTGTVVGDSISGLVWYEGFAFMEWQISREITELGDPGPPQGPSCDDILPILCTGDAEHCTELVLFDPDEGLGYVDYPQFEEIWGDQVYSYIRRDFMHLVKYALAKVECKTANWGYWGFSPVALGNMSESDGATPGTSVGTPYHLTHEDGNHIDVAYYQLYATDNRIRPVGEHFDGFTDIRHLVGEPYALDPWRTALAIAYLSEHPHLKFILVDELIGPILEEALDYLEMSGWIDSGLRGSIPLIYEPGLYYGHHNHLHATMQLLHPIVSDVQLKPDVLNIKSSGKYITGYIELIDGYNSADIDPTIGLIVNGHTILYSEPNRSKISDFNGNGVSDLTVKFNRKAVVEAIGTGTVEIAITGMVDNKFFQASDTIVVISP